MNYTTLTLVRGLPGTGKSTFAKAYDDANMIHLEADDYFIDPETGLYEYRKELISSAHRWCQDTTQILLMKGFDVIVSNTFTTRWEMETYYEIARKLKIKPITVFKTTRFYANTHDVPLDVVEKMSARWEDVEGEVVIS